MRFGAVLDSHDAVAQELLAPHEEHFADLLDSVEGYVQLVLRARYVEEAVLAEVVEEDPEVARLRQRTAGQPEDATYYDRIRLGELVAAAVAAKRDADRQEVLDAVLPLAADHVVREVSGLDAAVDVALLVDRDQVAAIEAASEDLAAARAGRMSLRLTGPTAPYDFVPGG
jgi:hypothetical protein